MKILYIIPGFMEHSNDTQYILLRNYFTDHGFHVIPIDITRKRHIMSDYVLEFLNKAKHHKLQDDVYILGFSFGAMISCIVSTKISIKGQFLCSLSPYFNEDLPNIKPRRKSFLGTHRISDFQQFSFSTLATQISSQTYIYYGSKEHPMVETRACEAKEKIKNSFLYIVPGAKHDIGDSRYIQTIIESISNMEVFKSNHNN